jgi:hypothetical protein
MDIEGSDEKPKRKIEKLKLNTHDDFQSDGFKGSDDDQSESSPTSSDLDMSSNQSSLPDRFESGASDSDVEQPSSKRTKAGDERAY